MTIVLTAYFLVSDMLYFYYNLPAILEQKALFSYVLLFLTGFVTAALRKPYTMYDARAAYDKSFKDSPLFIEVNILITRIWASIYLINSLLVLTAGYGALAIVLSNTLVAVGIVCSILIPNLMPES